MTWKLKVALFATACGCGEFVEGARESSNDDDDGTTTEPQGITLTAPMTGASAGSASSSGTDASESDPTDDPTSTTEPEETSATTESVDTTTGDPTGGSSEASSDSGVPVEPGFLDCLNDGEKAACIDTEACVYDSVSAPSVGVCAGMGCMNAGDCPAAPADSEAMPACVDVVAAEGNECILDCGGGEACPSGMICFIETLCVWAQEGLAVQDFEGGEIPVSWTLHDVDGNTPNANVSYIDDAWVVGMTGGGDTVAVSTSWYTPAGTSDDWLVTPAIAIGAASTLRFEARAPDPDFPDGYEVRISTAGTAVEGFMANDALLTVAEETSSFTAHMLDLAAAGYADQTVWIAWRNTTTDKFLLQVDDIEVTY